MAALVSKNRRTECLDFVLTNFFFSIVSNFNIMKTLRLLMNTGLLGCFHSPSDSDMDYRILF